jgi:hypothetical protein
LARPDEVVIFLTGSNGRKLLPDPGRAIVLY